MSARDTANKVGGYKYKPQHGIGGEWPFAPMELADDELNLCEALDNVTAAVEAGELGQDTWPEQLFASDEDLQWFLENLSQYDECYRIHDRWWLALATLIDHQHVEEGFSRCDDMADAIADELADIRQRKAAAVKSKKAKKAKASA